MEIVIITKISKKKNHTIVDRSVRNEPYEDVVVFRRARFHIFSQEIFV